MRCGVINVIYNVFRYVPALDIQSIYCMFSYVSSLELSLLDPLNLGLGAARDQNLPAFDTLLKLH